MSTDGWARDDAHAEARAEVAGMTREQLVARFTFLAPAKTLEGLREAVVALMLAPGRPLDGASLAAEQREREVADAR